MTSIVSPPHDRLGRPHRGERDDDGHGQEPERIVVAAAKRGVKSLQEFFTLAGKALGFIFVKRLTGQADADEESQESRSEIPQGSVH